MTNSLGAVLAAQLAQAGQGLIVGTVRNTRDGITVTSQGVELPSVTWLDPVTVADGDSVLLASVGARVGQEALVVLGRVTDGPRPTEGTVRGEGAGGRVMVETGTGTVPALYTWSKPGNGTRVMLHWVQGEAVVVGPLTGQLLSRNGVGAVVQPPRPPETEPVRHMRAAMAGSWNTHGDWVTGTLTTRGGLHVYWDYGQQGTAAGRPGRATVRLGERQRVGDWERPARVELWAAHGPAGSPEGAKHVVTLPPAGAGGPLEVPLPAHMVRALGKGAGLAMGAASPVTIAGLGDDPLCGQVELTD